MDTPHNLAEQVSTSGTLQLERRRPVDVLWAILEVRLETP